MYPRSQPTTSFCWRAIAHPLGCAHCGVHSGGHQRSVLAETNNQGSTSMLRLLSTHKVPGTSMMPSPSPSAAMGTRSMST